MMYNLPDPNSIFTLIANYATPAFNNLLPLSYPLLGFAVGGSILAFLMYSVGRGLRNAFSGFQTKSKFDKLS